MKSAAAALTRSDSEELLDFVGEAESLGGDEFVTPELLVRLGRLVEADSVCYSELDRVRKRGLFYVTRPWDEDEGDGLEDDGALFWDFVIDAHPVCLRHQQGFVGALKLSDFLTLRELHRSRLYDVWFRQWKMEYELSVNIASPLWHTKTFLFDRGPGRDFTERDRLVLDRLQPHLTRLWERARTRRLLSAALAALERASVQDPRGVILFGRCRDIEFASPPARRLLREFFPESREGRLPPVLVEWIESGGGRLLVGRRGERRLTIERSVDALLLEEKQEGLLTAREREVLAWVARGKTNAEVAQLLWVAPSTVRKHLENVYAKLGVNTRTAAVTSFLGLIDAEAS